MHSVHLSPPAWGHAAFFSPLFQFESLVLGYMEGEGGCRPMRPLGFHCLIPGPKAHTHTQKAIHQAACQMAFSEKDGGDSRVT